MVLGITVLCLGCSEQTQPSCVTQAMTETPTCAAIAATVVSHSCAHADENSPGFAQEQVTATSGSSGAPQVSKPHHVYRIDIPVSGGYVTFTPGLSGTWALFASSMLPHIEGVSTQSVGLPGATTAPHNCEGRFATAALMELAQWQFYSIKLDNTSDGMVTQSLIFEYVPGLFGADENMFVVDADRDGFGVGQDAIFLPCQDAPAGYVRWQGDDGAADPNDNNACILPAGQTPAAACTSSNPPQGGSANPRSDTC